MENRLITVGRRAAQFVQDLVMDLDDISKVRADLRKYPALGTVFETLRTLLWGILKSPSIIIFPFILLLCCLLMERLLGYRGAQGTTGTQASFMEIFHGDGAKIDKLNEILCEKVGFPSCYAISTQTYSRKVDLRIANALSSFGATVQKISSDVCIYFEHLLS